MKKSSFNKGRRLPQLPTDRPLPELPPDETPYSSRFTTKTPAKTPPPTRRMFTDVPPPIPPLSAIPKSNSAYFNRGERISLPDTSTEVAPPLPPRKVSVPAASTCMTYDSPRSSIYNVPKSMAANEPPSYDSLSSLQHHPSSTTSLPTTINYTTVSDSMTLQQLIDSHQHDLPIQVEVSAGYFGDSECDTFSEGDRLNFHFIKQVSVAVCESGGNGRKIKLPINSATQFAILYDPNNDIKEALFGFTFKSVKDMLALKMLPKIVCATKQHNSSNSAHSVQVGELLLINEVKHGRFGGQSLICTSLGSNKQKRLPENCQGHFSTRPDDVKMFLPELTKRFQLPLKVVAVGQSTTSSDVQFPFLPYEVVSIACIDKEVTVIATPILDPNEGDTIQESIMFDIPVDLEVMEVQIIEQTDSDNFEKLYVDTRQLMDNYDPSKLYKQVRVGKHDDIYYTTVCEDQKNAGIELLACEAIYSEATSVLSKFPSTKKTEPLLQPISNGHERQPSSPVPLILEDNIEKCTSTPEQAPQFNGHQNDFCAIDVLDKLSPSLSPAPSPVQYLGTSMQDVPMYMVSKFMTENMKQPDIDGLQKQMNEMKETIDMLKAQLEGVTASIKDLQNTVLDHSEYVQMVPAKNTKLCSMSCTQVLDMLETLNLGQYRDKFASESIDGTLLSELDEETLKDELGISSKIHRKKLIFVIQGKNTYQHLLQS